MFHLLDDGDDVANGAYAHQVPLPGAERANGMYYPDMDMLYVGSGRVEWDSATFRDPVVVDEEFAETHIGVPADEVIPTDLVKHFSLDDSATFTHEHGHGLLSVAVAPFSIPMYGGTKATTVLKHLLTTEEQSLDIASQMLGRQLETELYIQLTRPVQEAAAWIIGSYFSDEPMEERLAERIAEIDDEGLAGLEYRYAPPDYTHPSASSRRETLEREQFRLSYERAVLAAAHRACRAASDAVVCLSFMHIAKNATISSFAILTKSDVDPPEDALTEPAVDNLNAIDSLVEQIRKVDACAYDTQPTEAVIDALYYTRMAGATDPVNHARYLVRAAGMEDLEFFKHLLKNYTQRKQLPTILFIEQPSTNTVQVLFYGDQGVINQMIVSVFRRFLVRSLRTDTNLFEYEPVRKLLLALQTRFQGNVLDDLPTASLLQATEELYREARVDEDLREEWREMREFVADYSLETTLSDPSSARPFRESMEALCRYSPDEGVSEGDDPLPIATVEDGSRERIWSEILTDMLQRTASPERVEIFDRCLEVYAVELDEPELFRANVYGLGIGTLYRLDRGVAVLPDFEDWMEAYTTRLVDVLEETDESNAQQCFGVAFLAAAAEVLTSGFADAGARTVQTELTDLFRTAAEVADGLDVQWASILVPLVYERTATTDLTSDRRRSWLGAVTAAVLRTVDDAERAGAVCAALCEALGALAPACPPDDVLEIIVNGFESIAAAYERVRLPEDPPSLHDTEMSAADGRVEPMDALAAVSFADVEALSEDARREWEQALDRRVSGR